MKLFLVRIILISFVIALWEVVGLLLLPVQFYTGLDRFILRNVGINKYSNYLLSRDWVSSKWHPVLKVWEQLQDKHSKEMQNSYR